MHTYVIRVSLSKEPNFDYLLFCATFCWTATVLEGLFGEYHSSSAALGQQRPEVTKQPLVHGWSATPGLLVVLVLVLLKIQRTVPLVRVECDISVSTP